MCSYSGSVWIDEKPIISGVSLNTETLGPEPASRVVLDKTRDISVSLWIDGMEVGFLDLSDPPSRIEAGAYGRLSRDHFRKYENLGSLLNYDVDSAEIKTRFPFCDCCHSKSRLPNGVVNEGVGAHA